MYSRAEAIASMNNSKTNANGCRFQEVFAFRSFTEAVKAQMPNNVPTADFYTYNPAESAALCARLLEEVAESKTPDTGPDATDPGPTPNPSDQPPSALSTP